MTLDSYRSKVAFIVTPFAKAVAALHLTPNACTVLALLAAAASGIFFGLGETLIAVVLVLVSAFFDAIAVLRVIIWIMCLTGMRIFSLLRVFSHGVRLHGPARFRHGRLVCLR